MANEEYRNSLINLTDTIENLRSAISHQGSAQQIADAVGDKMDSFKEFQSYLENIGESNVDMTAAINLISKDIDSLDVASKESKKITEKLDETIASFSGGNKGQQKHADSISDMISRIQTIPNSNQKKLEDSINKQFGGDTSNTLQELLVQQKLVVEAAKRADKARKSADKVVQEENKRQAKVDVMNETKGFHSKTFLTDLAAGKGFSGAGSNYLINKIDQSKVGIDNEGGTKGIAQRLLGGKVGGAMSSILSKSGPWGMVAMAAKWIFDQAKALDKASGDVAKLYGTGYGSAVNQVGDNMITSIDGLRDFGAIDATKAAGYMKSVHSAGGGFNLDLFNKDDRMGQNTGAMAQRLGIDSDSAGKYQVMKYLFGDTKTDAYLKKFSKGLEESTDGMVTYKTIMKDLSSLSSTQIMLFGGYNKALEQSSQALALGMTSSIAGKAGMGFSRDIQSTIRNSMEMQMLTGQSGGNINKALALSMNDDTVGAVREMMGDTTFDEFKDMKSYQKEAYAKSLNLDVGQVGQSLKIQELLGTDSIENVLKMKEDGVDLSEEQKSALEIYSEMTDTRSVAEKSAGYLAGISSNVQGLFTHLVGTTADDEAGDRLQINLKEIKGSVMHDQAINQIVSARQQNSKNWMQDGVTGADINQLMTLAPRQTKEQNTMMMSQMYASMKANSVDDKLEKEAFDRLEKGAQTFEVTINTNIDQTNSQSFSTTAVTDSKDYNKPK